MSEKLKTEVGILLSMLARDINDAIDKLIVIRDGCSSDEKYKYRYVANKLEKALNNVHMAEDKLDSED